MKTKEEIDVLIKRLIKDIEIIFPKYKANVEYCDTLMNCKDMIKIILVGPIQWFSALPVEELIESYDTIFSIWLRGAKYEISSGEKLKGVM